MNEEEKMNHIFRLLSIIVLSVFIGGCGNGLIKAPEPQEIRIVQMCDTQLGMKDYQQELANLNVAVKQINELNPDAVIVCGDLVNKAEEKSFADFNAAVKPLKMPLYCVPGNHDIGDHPTSASMALFRKEIGEDHYTAEVKGYRIVVVNSMLWKYPGDALTQTHDAWFKTALESAAKAHQPIIIAGHCPLFVKNMEEKNAYYNVMLEKRKQIVDFLAKAGVKLVLFGHTHTAFKNNEQGIMFVNGPTTSINFDKKPFAFNLITISAQGVITIDTVNLAKQ